MRRFLNFGFFLIFLLISCDYKNNSVSNLSDISKEEVLKKFEKNFGDAIPNNALVSITALRDSPIKGLKEGAILFKRLDETQQLSFLISNDGSVKRIMTSATIKIEQLIELEQLASWLVPGAWCLAPA